MKVDAVALLAVVGSALVAQSPAEAACTSYAKYKQTSEKSCSTLFDEGGGNDLETFPGKGICQAANFGCSKRTYFDTYDLCNSRGMRLCRSTEPVQYGGCAIQNKRVWYEGKCDSDSNPGALSNVNGLTDTNCVANSRGGPFPACCADEDTTTEECGSCPENAHRDDSLTYVFGIDKCSCNAGFRTVYEGAGQGGGLKECVRLQTSDLTSCPKNTYSVRSESSCESLSSRGYSQIGDVCAASFNALGDNACPPSESNDYRDAAAYCAVSGARLCSVQELEDGGLANAVHSGSCPVNDMWVWTGSSCDGDATKAFQIKAGSSATKCVSKTSAESSPIMCCADPGTSAKCKSCPPMSSSPQGSTEESDCTCNYGVSSDGSCGQSTAPTSAPTPTPPCPPDTFLTTVSAKNPKRPKKAKASPLVYGYQPMENRACPDARSHAQAETFCKARQARLCTANEIARGETKGTGCGNDKLWVWTSTPCCEEKGTCDDEKYIAFAGKGRKGRFPAGPKGVCRSASDSLNIRCCRDVDSTPDCDNCPKNSSADAGSTDVTDCKCDPGYWGSNGGFCTPDN